MRKLMAFAVKMGKAGVIFAGTASAVFVILDSVNNMLENCFSLGEKLHRDPFNFYDGKEQLILFGNCETNLKTMVPSSSLTSYPSDETKLLTSSKPSLPLSSLVLQTNNPSDAYSSRPAYVHQRHYQKIFLKSYLSQYLLLPCHQYALGS